MYSIKHFLSVVEGLGCSETVLTKCCDGNVHALRVLFVLIQVRDNLRTMQTIADEDHIPPSDIPREDVCRPDF